MKTFATFALCVTLAGCSWKNNPSAPSSTSSPAPGSNSGTSGGSAGVTAADLTYCVTETNRYRAIRGRSALTRNADLEAYSAESAKVDTLAQSAHQHYRATSGGGISRAENEIPWWPTNLASTLQGLMTQGIATFYGEGPGGGHYENLMSNAFTQLGCGVYITGGSLGSTTIVQNFR